MVVADMKSAIARSSSKMIDHDHQEGLFEHLRKMGHEI